MDFILENMDIIYIILLQLPALAKFFSSSLAVLMAAKFLIWASNLILPSSRRAAPIDQYRACKKKASSSSDSATSLIRRESNMAASCVT